MAAAQADEALAECADRRARLAQAIGAGGVALIAAAPAKTRNNDVEYPYRAASDFRYLTGFVEPGAIAALAPGHADGDFQLFCRPRDPARETWVGRRVGTERAAAEYGADAAFEADTFAEQLPGLLDGRQTLYIALGEHPSFERRVLKTLAGMRSQGRARVPPPAIVRLDRLIHPMRQIKSAVEIELMRRAAAISVAAHLDAMAATQPGKCEYELAATLHYRFEAAGAHWAYPTIVGAGANACILHYNENETTIADGDLILIDAGAEYAGYAGDITRTLPANGRFSAAQRRLYDVVLAANRAAIDAARPGAPANAPHGAALDVLIDGLIDLGLIDGPREAAHEDERYRDYFMHGTSHWLGMDVHDVGDYKVDSEWVELKPGMALTVEPGLYIGAEAEGVAAEYRGIGIRIEDDIVITETGCEVLSAGVPKDAEAIEARIGKPR